MLKCWKKNFPGRRTSLEQKVMVAQHNQVNLRELLRWSKNEGKLREFKAIEKD